MSTAQEPAILDSSEQIKLPPQLEKRLEAEQAKFGKGDLSKQEIDRELEEAAKRKEAEDQARAQKAAAMSEGEYVHQQGGGAGSTSAEGLAAKASDVQAQLDELKALNEKLAQTEERRKELAEEIEKTGS